jgi:hypothetical protein
MKSRIPFTDYDFYAYLVSGMSLLFVLDLSFNEGTLLSPSARIVHFILASVIAYILGQLLASASAVFLETVFVNRFLGHPVDVQLGVTQKRLALAKALGGRFYRPFSPALRQIIDDKIGADPVGHKLAPYDKYELAYARVRTNSDTAGRLEVSRNQYTFARNIALAAFLDMLLFIYMAWQGVEWGWVAVSASLIVAAGMTHRFLKFYSTFYAQIFRAFLAST